MFRKPKRKVKETLRFRKTEEDEEDDNNNKIAEASAQPKSTTTGDEADDDDESLSTSDLIREAQKRIKKTIGTATTTTATTGISEDGSGGKAKIMHSYATSSTRGLSHAERATSTAQHLPEKLLGSGVAGPKDDDADNQAQQQRGGDDGIFRGDKIRNKFWAGPIRAAANVRVTARFDYQPDICKDYKDTGFCGFGDTCIYLHDRGDTLAGWQIDQQWELDQKRKKDAQEIEMQNFLDSKSSGNGGNGSSGDGNIAIESGSENDGLPFACFLCREHFKDPVVTTCQHYFCQDCIMDHIRNTTTDNGGGGGCPICNKDTHGVFHQPTKLLAKKRKALGSSAAAKAENSWEAFYKLYSSTSAADNE